MRLHHRLASRRHAFRERAAEDCHIEQIFPNPAVPEHAPDAKPWTVERMDPETVRLNAATSKQPSARIFAIRRA